MINTHIRFLRVLTGALLLFGGVFLLSNYSLAESSLIADSLLIEGKGLYAAGEYEKAIPLFSKALLIQPRNKEALEYLKKMGLNGGIYGSQKTMIDRIYDLIDDIELYRQDLRALEEQSRFQVEQTEQVKQQKQYLEELIQQKEQEKQQLMEKSEEFYAVAVMKGKEVAELQNVTEQKTGELVRLNTDLFETKKQLLSDREVLESRNAELTTIRKNLDQYQKMSETQLHELKMQYEKDILELQKKRDALEHEIFNVADDRDEKVRRFDDALRQKDAMLTLEQGRLAVTSYQLAKQEAQVLRMREQVQILYTQRQDLIKEAEALREQIRQLRQDQNFRYARTADTKTKPQKLVEHIKKQDEQIIDLKAHLTRLLEEAASLQKTDAVSEKEMAVLQDKIRALETEISDKEKELSFSKEQTASLEGRIKDYQERWDVVEEMIKDKEDRILFLEKEMGSDVF